MFKLKQTVIILGMLLLATLMVGCQKEADKDVLKVGMELKWPPFETIDGSGNPTGISVMIAEEIGAYLDVEVEIVDLPFGSLIPALESEQIDVIIGSMSITEERKQSINFSDPYMYFKILSVVNDESQIASVEDIFEKDGLTFVAPKSFATLDIARKKAKNPVIKEFDDKAAAAMELANGKADVFMVDAIAAVAIEANYPDLLSVIYDPVMVFPIGMGLRKGDDALLNDLNAFIEKSESLGVHDRIRDAYDATLKDMVGKGYEFYLNED